MTGRSGEEQVVPNLRGGLIRLGPELCAALVATLCYLNVLPNDFCDDGVPIVEQNPLVQQPDQWLRNWTTDYWFQSKDAAPNRDLLYRPLTLTSLRAVRTWFGDAPWPQHVLNILLHAVVTVGVVRLCRTVTTGDGAAWTAGLLFAALPIHTEVIANVVGRADLLATLGTIGALLTCHQQGWRSPSHQNRDSEGADSDVVTGTACGGLLWLALFVFTALSAKESGVCVLALLPLGHWVWRRKPSGAWLVAMVIPALLYFALRYHALEGHLFQKPALTKTVNMLVDAPAWQRVLGAAQLWGMYWTKTIWPDILSVNYSINALRPATSVFHPYVLVGMGVLVALLAVVVGRWRRGERGIAFVAGAIIISYLPTANLLVLIQVSFAERIWYLPSAFVCVLCGWLWGPFLIRPAAWLAIGLVIFGMTVRCGVRNSEWRDNLTLYAAAYRDAPDAVGALRLFGVELVRVGDYERGIELLHRAIEIDLGFTDAQRSLGQAYLLMGDPESAVRHLQIADMQIPDHPPTQAALRHARAILLETRQSSLNTLHQEADSAPGDAEKEIALLRALREVGLLDDVLDRLRLQEPRFQGRADWQYEYAVTLVTANRLDEAVERYEQSLALDRAHPARLVELAMLRIERRQGDDLEHAAQMADEALRQAPGLPEALVCRAELLALSGDFSTAADHYRKAIASLEAADPRRRFWMQRAKTLGGD